MESTRNSRDTHWLRRFFVNIPMESWNSLRTERLRILWIGLLFAAAVICALLTDADSKGEKISIHFSMELLGAIVVFLLLERNIEKVAELSGSKIRERSDFPFDDFFAQIKNSKFVRIQDFSLITLLGDSNVARRRDFLAAIRYALSHENGVVEILLAKPNSNESKNRARTLESSLGGPSETFDAIARSLQVLLNFVHDQSSINGMAANLGRISIRFFDGHPGFAMYQAGEWAYVNFYADRPTILENQLCIPMVSKVGAFLGRAFRTLNEKAQTEWSPKEVEEWLSQLKSELESPPIIPIDKSSDPY